jgi:hypothetical protein
MSAILTLNTIAYTARIYWQSLAPAAAGRSESAICEAGSLVLDKAKPACPSARRDSPTSPAFCWHGICGGQSARCVSPAPSPGVVTMDGRPLYRKAQVRDEVEGVDEDSTKDAQMARQAEPTRESCG